MKIILFRQVSHHVKRRRGGRVAAGGRETVRRRTSEDRPREMQEMQVHDREGRDTDWQVRDELLRGWKTDAGLASCRLSVRRVRQTARDDQEDR